MEVLWLAPLFVAGWLLFTGAMAHLGGWAALAKDFAADAPPEGQRFRFASGSLGRSYFPVYYRGCLFLTLAAEGLHLSVLPILRFRMPPLFIPWRAVESIIEERELFMRRTIITLRGHWPRLTLRGQVGERVMLAYAAQQARRA
ncbi:MAG TPA: hypothetical protein VF211_14940 [Burkholderiales bacterium]